MTIETGWAGEDQATRLRELVRSKAEATEDTTRDDLAPSPRAQTMRNGSATGRSGAWRVDGLASQTAAPPRVIALASGKGGVGKTSLAVNLCVALARRGVRVVLLDGDLGLANADVLCGIRPTGHVGHLLNGSRTIEQIVVQAPGGFRLVPGGGGQARLAEVGVEQRIGLLRAINDLDRPADVIVVDCAAGAGDDVLSFLWAADAAALVTTPEPTAIADAYALLKRFWLDSACGNERSVAPSLLVNQARRRAEAEATHRRIATVAERFLGSTPELAGWVRRDAHVAEAVSAKRPFALARPRSVPARQVGRFAEHLRRRIGLERRRKFRILGNLRRLIGA